MRAFFVVAVIGGAGSFWACSSGSTTTVLVAPDGGASDADAAATNSGASPPLPTSGGGRQEADTTALCSYLATCGAITASETDACKVSYAGILFTSDCLTKLNAAIGAKDCSGIADTGDVTAACFPDCDDSDAVCNTDGTFAQCRQGSVAVVSCQTACAANGQTYSGTCGKSFETKTSATDQCWCTGGDAGT